MGLAGVSCAVDRTVLFVSYREMIRIPFGPKFNCFCSPSTDKRHSPLSSSAVTILPGTSAQLSARTILKRALAALLCQDSIFNLARIKVSAPL